MSHDVSKFGAIGDGATDDRSAIQHAIDEAHASGGAVFLPHRRGYKIDGSLHLPSGTTLIGDYKWYGTTLATDPPQGLIGDRAHPVLTTGRYPRGDARQHRNISIIGLAVSNENAAALELKTANNFLLRDCLFSAKDSEAVVIRESPRGRVENCFIASSSPGSPGAVSDAEVPAAHGHFALSARDNCNGLTIDGCTITGGELGSAIDLSLCQGVRIVGNTMEVNGEYGIRIPGPPREQGGGNCHGFEISGNYFEVAKFPLCLGSCETGAHSAIAGRVFGNYITTRNNGVGNNAVDRARWMVLFERCVGVSVTNNSFITSDEGPPVFRFKTPSATGSSLTDTPYDCEINHNVYTVQPADALSVIDAGYPISERRLLADNSFDFRFDRYVIK